MKLRELVFALLAVTLVMGCTRNEPAQETPPPAPDFESPTFEEGMDDGMDGTLDDEDGTLDDDTDTLDGDTM